MQLQTPHLTIAEFLSNLAADKYATFEIEYTPEYCSAYFGHTPERYTIWAYYLPDNGEMSAYDMVDLATKRVGFGKQTIVTHDEITLAVAAVEAALFGVLAHLYDFVAIRSGGRFVFNSFVQYPLYRQRAENPTDEEVEELVNIMAGLVTWAVPSMMAESEARHNGGY